MPQGFRFRISSFGFRVSGFDFRVSGFGLQFESSRGAGFGTRVSGFGFGFRIQRFRGEKVSGLAGRCKGTAASWLLVWVFGIKGLG